MRAGANARVGGEKEKSAQGGGRRPFLGKFCNVEGPYRQRGK